MAQKDEWVALKEDKMPIYEYHCSQCGNSFEEIRSMEERDKELVCPKCHSILVERMMSVFSYGEGPSGDVCGLPSSGHG